MRPSIAAALLLAAALVAPPGPRHRRRRHAARLGPGHERPEGRLRLRERPLDRFVGRRLGRPAADVAPRRRVGPALLARRHARRLHGPLRREHRRLRRARGRRRAEAAHVPPRRRRRPRLHAGRPVGPVLVAARRSTRRGTRSSSRCRWRAASPTRLPIPNASQGGDLARREDDRVRAARRGVPPVEALPRRDDLAHPALRQRDATPSSRYPQPAGRCNDTDPMWLGDRLYFRSDRDGEFNLYAFDRATKAVTRLTTHADLPGALRHGRRRPDRLRAGAATCTCSTPRPARRSGSSSASPPTSSSCGRGGRREPSGCATRASRPRAPASLSSSEARS